MIYFDPDLEKSGENRKNTRKKAIISSINDYNKNTKIRRKLVRSY